MVADLCFVDASYGWASGALWPDIGVMLHTENGGGGLAGVGADGRGAPALRRGQMRPASPNPFQLHTRIRFAAPGEVSLPVTIAVFDLQGRRIRSLVDGLRKPGEHSVSWDGLTDRHEPVTSGVYIYSVTVGEFATGGKLTMLR